MLSYYKRHLSRNFAFLIARLRPCSPLAEGCDVQPLVLFSLAPMELIMPWVRGCLLRLAVLPDALTTLRLAYAWQVENPGASQWALMLCKYSLPLNFRFHIFCTLPYFISKWVFLLQQWTSLCSLTLFSVVLIYDKDFFQMLNFSSQFLGNENSSSVSTDLKQHRMKDQ